MLLRIQIVRKYVQLLSVPTLHVCSRGFPCLNLWPSKAHANAKFVYFIALATCRICNLSIQSSFYLHNPMPIGGAFKLWVFCSTEIRCLIAGFFFNIFEKTQDQKNSTAQKTQRFFRPKLNEPVAIVVT